MKKHRIIFWSLVLVVGTSSLSLHAQTNTNTNSNTTITIPQQQTQSPAAVQSTVIPAQIQNIEKQVVAGGGAVNVTKVPAQYNTVERQVKVQDGGFTGWAEVGSCEGKPITDTPVTIATNNGADMVLTKEKIQQIQMALIGKGFSPGPVDGTWSDATENALQQYQQAYNITGSRAEILKSLNF